MTEKGGQEMALTCSTSVAAIHRPVPASTMSRPAAAYPYPIQVGRASTIDTFIESDDKIFVLGEYKYQGTELPCGQRIAFERTCDALYEAGKYALFFVAAHDADRGSKNYDAATCMVVEYRTKKTKHKPRKPTTVRKLIDRFFEYVEEKEITEGR